MHRLRDSFLTVGLLVLSSNAFAQSPDPELVKALSKYFKNGQMVAGAQETVQASLKAAATAAATTTATPTASKSSTTPPTQSINLAIANSSTSPVPPGTASVAPKQYPDHESFNILLRQSFSDIWLYSDPTSPADSTGASVSWSRDQIANNTLWSVQGMGAAVWSYHHDPGAIDTMTGPGFLGVSLAPYAQVDRELNSNPKLKSKSTDVDTLGGTAELGFRKLLGGDQYFREKFGYVQDNKANTTAISSTTEWIPYWGTVADLFCVGQPCPFFGSSTAIYYFHPELEAQYDAATGTNDILAFSNRDEALRIGPAASLIVRPFGHPTADPLTHLHVNITAHWAEEVLTMHPYVWFEPNVNYDLTESGNLGLTLDYRRGRDEISGEKNNVIKISLTGKL